MIRCELFGLRSFHRAGEERVNGRVVQHPAVEILEPKPGAVLSDPSSILLRWKTAFVRFDNGAFMDAYPPDFSEPEEDLVYSVLFSRDAGESWYYVLNGKPATLGKRPTDTNLLLPDAGDGDESFLIESSSFGMPAGEYLLRVECYHRTRLQHGSHHYARVVIRR